MIKNKPTPAATVKIIVRSGTAVNCLASTCKSGSATVTAKPIKKHRKTIIIIFFEAEIDRPTSVPIGIIDKSVPREKKPIPTISITEPKRKSISIPAGIGARFVKLRISTIKVIGKTDEIDSLIFCFNNSFMITPLLFYYLLLYNNKKRESRKKAV